jgi:F-type H+-transporting ATPase subunit epsilon
VARLSAMHLRILLPFRVFTVKADVLRMIAETSDGSLGILPHRLDCVAHLRPGILTYQSALDGEVYVAVDQGVLVKNGPEVLVSVRNAIAGADLGQLREAVQRDFLSIDEREQGVRMVMEKLEAGLVRRLALLQHE